MSFSVSVFGGLVLFLGEMSRCCCSSLAMSAMRGRMSEVAISSMDWWSLESSLEADSPTCGMPREKIHLERGWLVLACWRESMRVWARFSPKRRCLDSEPSDFLAGSSWRSARVWWLRVKRSSGVLTRLYSTSLMATDSPRPSMSRALRLAKWVILVTAWAGQVKLVHFQATASSSREMGAEQDGQVPLTYWKKSNGVLLDGRLSVMTLTTEGMISPAFSMTTVSSRRMSLRWISSSLWRVARETVVPETKTGSSSATGVRTPVRPTWMVMSRRMVSICSGRNL